MSGADGAIGAVEVQALFSDLVAEPALILAVSGGPDSTALLHLMVRWRAMLEPPSPHLIAVTVDHGLRPEAALEAEAVAEQAERLGVDHVTLHWSGAKPSTGLQEAARHARYRLLRQAALSAGASCVVTAHTLDDQAETILLRMARGSGLAGLAGMARRKALDGHWQADETLVDDIPAAFTRVDLVRPLLEVPKSRLIITLQEAGTSYAEDPSNADPRFTRTRLRRLSPLIAEEGLTPGRLARLARRVRRSEAAHEAAVAAAVARFGLVAGERRLEIGTADWRALPAEIALRLLGRIIGMIGIEGPVELGKLEALTEALDGAVARGATQFRRTLAGAMVSLQKGIIIIEVAPPRRCTSRWGPSV